MKCQFVDLNSLFVEGETERLYIRSYKRDDYADSLSMYSDPILTKFFDHGQPRNQEEVDAYLSERGSYAIATGLPFGLFSVFQKDSHVFIGQVDVVPTGEPGEVEIGWIFRQEFQNLGYCSEAVQQFLLPLIKEFSRRGFSLGGKLINRVVATAHPENLSSQRIMSKAGMSFYKTGLRYKGNPRNWYQLKIEENSQMEHKTDPGSPVWEPTIYNKLAIAQRAAVLKALEHLNIEKSCHILDVGCGEGKMSAELARIAERGRVLGIDRSQEMIDFAVHNYATTSYENLQFLVQDARDINFIQEFNVVFSSFALQWIKDKNEFFTKAYSALKHDGRMCVICPLRVSPELELATEQVMDRPQWAGLYADFHPGWYFSNKEELSHLIREACFKITYSHAYVQEVEFQSREDFERYVLLWYPYLSPLEDALKPVFFAQVIDEYCKLLPPLKNGEVRMRIPTAFWIADKISP